MAGRKSIPVDQKKVTVSIVLTPLQYADLLSLKARGLKTNRLIGRWISSEATRLDLLDLGF